MTQEQVDRCSRQLNIAMQEFASDKKEEAIERLKMLIIYLKDND